MTSRRNSPKTARAAFPRAILLVLAVALVGGLAAGCKSDDPKRIRWDSLPQEHGIYVTNMAEAQVRKAASEHFVLYDRHWANGRSQLLPHGKARLEDIADRLAVTPYHEVVIEPTGDGMLDQRRADAVLRYLTAMLEFPEGLSVVVADPRTPSLTGEEALRINEAAALN